MTTTREKAIKIAGALNSELESFNAAATTWLKVEGKERVYLQTTGRKGGTRLGHVEVSTLEFVPERFAGKNHASDEQIAVIEKVLATFL